MQCGSHYHLETTRSADVNSGRSRMCSFSKQRSAMHRRPIPDCSCALAPRSLGQMAPHADGRLSGKVSPWVRCKGHAPNSNHKPCKMTCQCEYQVMQTLSDQQIDCTTSSGSVSVTVHATVAHTADRQASALAHGAGGLLARDGGADGVPHRGRPPVFSRRSWRRGALRLLHTLERHL